MTSFDLTVLNSQIFFSFLHIDTCQISTDSPCCNNVILFSSYITFFCPPLQESDMPLSVRFIPLLLLYFLLLTWECVNMELLWNWLLLFSVQCVLPPINLWCLQKKLKNPSGAIGADNCLKDPCHPNWIRINVEHTQARASLDQEM